MAVRLLVPMEVAFGKRDELIEAFRVRCSEVRLEPGCEEFELYQSTERPDQLLLVEKWTDEATLQAHGELNRQRGSNVASLRKGTTQAERYTMQDTN